jgi:GAF domain-containing protein
MLKPIIPENEAERLKTLQELNILDTSPEERFDRVTRYAANLFKVPIALVSLVDEDRQWFKSRVGIDATETPRDISFCAHAINSNEVFMVVQTRADPRFADNPLVTGEPRIRFYAGAPLEMENGMRVGTLCMIDKVPRVLDEAELQQLTELAKVIVKELQGEGESAVFLDSLDNRLPS